MTCFQGLTLNEPGSVPGLSPFRCTQCVSCMLTGYLRKAQQVSFIHSNDLVVGFISPGATPESTVPEVSIIIAYPVLKSVCIDVSGKCDYVTTFATVFFRGTNPFATVKLRPTTTNDRSAPRIL